MFLFLATAGAVPLTEVVDLRARRDRTCALRADHTVWCWGDGDAQAAQVAEQVAAIATPTCWSHLDGSLNCGAAKHIGPVVSLLSWGGRVCGADATGVVRCVGNWAYKGGGPLGVDPTTPTEVPGWSDVVELSPTEPCARFRDGRIGCLTVRGVAFRDDLPAARRLDDGCIVGVDDTLWCWGARGPAKRLGAGGAVARGTGKYERHCWAGEDGVRCKGRVGPGNSVKVTGRLVMGDEHGCAIVHGGQVACWGDGGRGQWGDGDLPPWPTDIRGRERRSVPVCQLEGETLRCDAEEVWGSPTVPPLVIEGVDRWLEAHEPCALRGESLTCLSPDAPGLEIPEPVVINGVQDADGEYGTILLHTADQRVSLRYGDHFFPLDFDRVEAVSMKDSVACILREGEVWCLDMLFDQEVPRRLEVAGPVHSLDGDGCTDQGDCAASFAGKSWDPAPHMVMLP